MALTFYYGSGSPFAWKVWLALEHKRVPYELRILSFSAGDLRTPAYAAINPHRRVPAIDDDGFVLYESSAIVEYLEDRHDGPRLWPDDVRARAIARRLAAEADWYVFPRVERILGETFFRGGRGTPDAAVIAAERAAIREALARMRVGDDLLVGGAPTAADFALYPLLAQLRRIDAKFPGHDLACAPAYMARVEALPYLATTVPPHYKE